MDRPTIARLGAADIAAAIRRDINHGILQLHDRLPPERVLAATHGVARGTVQRALRRLAREKLVEIRPGSGTYVVEQVAGHGPSPVEHANPLELIDARFALEPQICRLAVLYGRRQEFDRLEELCERMENSLGDPVVFATADTDFHRTLAQCTHNGLMIWFVGQITSLRSQDEWTRMRQLTLDRQIIGQYNVQHREILKSIRIRDPDSAATKMKEHLETARLSLTRAAET